MHGDEEAEAELKHYAKNGAAKDAVRKALENIKDALGIATDLVEELVDIVGGDESDEKPDEAGTNTTRVGRWMSQEEYDKMISTGKVQMSGDNKVHVANPADIKAFEKQAPKGSLYVEFDVPSNTISKGGNDGWGIVNGPGSLLDRLYGKKGLPRITEIPSATNIIIGGKK